MPAAFDEQERVAIRSRLLEAAMEALRRGGLGAVSIAALATSASIAKGSFYAFYPSKEHLFMEALESIEDRYRISFAEAASGPGAPVERLERAFRAAFNLIGSEPALRSVDASTMERISRALPPERLAEHAARDAESIARLASDWRDAGLLAAGTDSDELLAAGYAVFLVAVGLQNLPKDLRQATEGVMVRGLARSLAATFLATSSVPAHLAGDSGKDKKGSSA